MRKVLLFANTAWYLFNFRLKLAQQLSAAGYEVVLASPQDEYVSEIERAGFRWEEIDVSRRGMNPFAELLAWRKIVRVYRREQPDLVHHFTIKPVIYGTFAAIWTRVPRVVNAVTGLGYLFIQESAGVRFLRRIVFPFYRKALGHPSVRVIFQNKNDKELFIHHRLVKSAVTHVIPGSGVDVDRFAMSAPPREGMQVVLIARMLRDKGIVEFVQAARILKKAGVAARFILVGGIDSGNLASIPAADLERWQAEGSIEWWGHQDDIPALLLDSHIVVLPSYREGLPRTLIEASATGRPVVATNVPGCRDVVTDGVNGLLVPMQDATRLAAAIQYLIEHPQERERMGRAGRQLAVKQFSAGRINAATINVYQELFQE